MSHLARLAAALHICSHSGNRPDAHKPALTDRASHATRTPFARVSHKLSGDEWVDCHAVTRARSGQQLVVPCG